MAVRVIGVDPGTRSFDLCSISDNRCALDISYPAKTVALSPEEIVEAIEGFEPDLVVGPSGMGVPIRRISELSDRERFELTLEKEGDKHAIGVLEGLRKMVDLMAARRMDIRFIPGVIHLPTIPRHRKVNKIDMGTADKMAIAALAVSEEAESYHSADYAAVNFVLIEIGFGYNAALAVKGGEIVDGIGGTIFPGPAFVNMGALDGEVAYLLGDFSKTVLFSGGVCHIMGHDIISPEEFGERIETGDEAARIAFAAFAEGILKAMAMELLAGEGGLVLLSGRLSRCAPIRKRLIDAITEKFDVEVRCLKGFARKAKEAAQGACIIAEGLAGGRHKRLIEHMKICGARGGLLDNIRIPHLLSRL